MEIYKYRFIDINIGKMDNLQIINGIPIGTILNTLKIQYRPDGYCLCLFESNKETDGRKVNIQLNYINDFSWKWRAKGQPFAFVKSYLGLDNKQTFERFQNNFGVWWGVIKKTKTPYKKRGIVRLPSYYNNR